jgi:hypothetical protein
MTLYGIHSSGEKKKSAPPRTVMRLIIYSGKSEGNAGKNGGAVLRLRFGWAYFY